MKIWQPLKAIFKNKRSKSKEDETLVGRIAQSVSGRDKGMIYVITGQPDGVYVNVCDGSRRTLRQPKRKNIRHLLISAESVPETFIKDGKIDADDTRIAAFIKERTDI